MNALTGLIRMELFVLSKDKRVMLKLFLSFLLIIYVLSFSIFEQNSNILPFFYFGFFFASPLIDYSFYMERVHKRFLLLIGKGFSLRQIITAKTLTIFFIGVLFGLIFTLIAIYLASIGLLHAETGREYLSYFFLIAFYNLFTILLSGILQTRLEILFPVRLLHIAGFLLFVNFQKAVVVSIPSKKLILLSAFLTGLTLICIYSAGRINTDKIV